MEKLLKKGHSSIIYQLHSIQAIETTSVHPDLQSILSRHQVVFTTPNKLPPFHGVHDHSIPLISGSLPPNIHPYRHTFSQKNEIEKIEEASVIHPITIHYSSPVVMVLGKCVLIFVPSTNSQS
jgi:hypothetical protein